jgi:hypothetical protein
MPCFSPGRVYTQLMRFLAPTLATALTLMACAPTASTPTTKSTAQAPGTQTPGTQSAGTQSPGTQQPAQSRAVAPRVSLELFPIKKGETWAVAASSNDDSENKEFALQLDEGPSVEQDEDGAPVFLASAIAGDTFADLAYYPDDALLFIKIPLEVKRDAGKAKNIFCFFENFEAGKSRSKGQSFFGTPEELRQAQSRNSFGECVLSKNR